MLKNLIIGLFLVSMLIACGDEEVPPITMLPDEETGVIIVNQGNFGSGTGTLTYNERDTNDPMQNVYSEANDGAVLGNVAQSMIEHLDKYYIAINNGGKVVVTENDFTSAGTIEGINQGRYFASNGSKLYLSSWGDTGSNGGVYELDASTNTVIEFIETGSGPEGMVFADDLLYVAKGGGFGTDSLLLIIDPTDNSIMKSIVVGDNPQLIVKDKNEDLYVICKGLSDWMNPSNNTPGSLVKIKDQEIAWSIELPNGSSNLAIDQENENLYFVSEGNVLKQSINSTVLSTTIVRSVSAYALGFDKVDERLYIADTKDFQQQGTAYIYSANDEVLDSIVTGVGPGYFQFQ